jgi:hypothetical protein
LNTVCQIAISKAAINRIAEFCVADYKPDALDEPAPIMADEFAELYLRYRLRYENLSNNKSVLGTIAFNGGKLPVYDDENDDVKRITVKPRTSF